MNKQIISAELEKIGLEEIEVKIYLFLLEKGSQTHLELSRAINVDRSKVYRDVEKLIRKKLIEQSHTEWGKKLQASSPSNILLLIEDEEERIKAQKKSLSELIKELTSIPTYTEREFEVKHYRGQEGLRQMLWNHLSAQEDILVFGFKNRNDIVGKTYAEKIRTEQVARRLKLYEIENESDKGDYWYTDVLNWDKFYESGEIPKQILDIKQYVVIFNNTVSIINWAGGEEVGLEIINSAYADMQKQIFWNFWKIVTKNTPK